MRALLGVVVLSAIIAVLLGSPVAYAQNQKSSEIQNKEEKIMKKNEKTLKMRFVLDGEEITVTMEDNPASRDFLSMLPLTLSFEDYNGTEKISYLPRKLNAQGAPSSCNPSAGSVAYYMPWGNLAIFYRDFRHSNGLVPLGKIEGGIEKLARKQGNFSISLESAD